MTVLFPELLSVMTTAVLYVPTATPVALRVIWKVAPLPPLALASVSQVASGDSAAVQARVPEPALLTSTGTVTGDAPVTIVRFAQRACVSPPITALIQGTPAGGAAIRTRMSAPVFWLV